MNHFTVTAVIVKKSALRYTPAGIEVLEMLLAHTSEQTEEGETRQVSFEISAIAFGRLALALNRVTVKQTLRCEGFLNQRSQTGKSIRLHLVAFELTN